ncbi:Platelet-activating factor acetylhydrolase plasma/intracellular isoform II [Kribbella flavida DSM 17836]|uniref:Platelet-activating factor acetylhydrolase plasma/intracellular isoform II n=1 Tax=Kribbella flavida (strain DSM 17836 / JCM 10339 / NBRC 14399) TaxID=479435 RepID=D2Q3K4_KRIFD|nr:Platelet-activating factor acetylhydrolase plasma/intracellular isoform II [Kribbella flavida]ADB34127.1 Platelet-activating factor acetylhydrolase plasma/intracellular isoform II [Kribbella flavida DSM 17836]
MRKPITATITAFALALAATALPAGPARASLASPAGRSACGSGLVLRLPAPTGRHQVGTTTLHLADPSRPDPWNKSATRELMTTVYYPASTVHGFAPAPHLTPAAATVFGRLDAGVLHPELPSCGVDWAATTTHAYAGAPAAAGRRPVLLYSPGGADPRTIGTSLAVDLASHGYVVVTLDHPGETSEVDFPGRPPRTIEVTPAVQTDPVLNRLMMTTRFADTRFVLDQLERLAAGHHPDASHRPLPRGLHRALDLRRVGVYGHSAGGATAAQAMYQDRRIDAAVNLEGYLDLADGSLHPIAQHGTDRPLLLVGTDGFRDARFDRTWSAMLAHDGPVRRVELRQSRHWVFTDYAAFAPQLVAAGLMTPAERTSLIGDHPRAIPVVRAVVRRFFQHSLAR